MCDLDGELRPLAIPWFTQGVKVKSESYLLTFVLALDKSLADSLSKIMNKDLVPSVVLVLHVPYPAFPSVAWEIPEHHWPVSGDS